MDKFIVISFGTNCHSKSAPFQEWRDAINFAKEVEKMAPSARTNVRVARPDDLDFSNDPPRPGRTAVF